ncbi:MAG: rRNA maturation RNase YbeY [Sphingobacteriales bacterium JAD_PAG50586_3]|nr:MAG: rRNA maturation RNase YbeY [Sphingobacteriales bacterium JAD_PAG50586_3]
MSRNISFRLQDVKFTLKDKQVLRNWVALVASNDGYSIAPINYVFCSDTHLLEMNKQFLNHNYFTDIITFDYTEGKRISGDIFISIDRVADNAKTYKSTFEQELHRVMIHGVLHLMGYKDKSPADEKKMRAKENAALKLLPL